MLGYRLTICLLAGSLVAPAASAQRAGSIEAGALVRGTLFDPSLQVQTALGAGGRAAAYLAPFLFVEVDFSSTTVNGLASFPRASYQPLHARLNFLTPYSDRGKAIVGLGVVTTHYGGDFDKSDKGIASLFGLRIDLHRSLVGRLDVTFDYVPSPANGAGNNWIGGMHLGIGYAFRQ